MKTYTLCYYSATSMEIPSLSQGARLYQKNGGEIRVIARTMSQLFDESRVKAFIQDALESDVIILTLHGGKASCPAFDALVEQLEAVRQLCHPERSRRDGNNTPYFHIQPVGGDEDALFLAQNYSDGFGEEFWNTINAYMAHGGHLNFQNLLIYLYNILFQENTPLEPPLKLPHEGVYHPDVPGIPDIEDYITQHVDPQKLTVGLWFYQTYWINNNLAYIDAIIREIEHQGANVIPVFHLRYPDELLGNHGADYIVEHFFMNNGHSRIDVLINPMLFSMTLTAPQYKSLYPALNVPCIQAMVTMRPYMKSGKKVCRRCQPQKSRMPLHNLNLTGL
jgi:cobaltochelatase CobN